MTKMLKKKLLLRNALKKNTDELNSQISEINNKISFIMNQINKEDDESKNVANH